MLAGSLAVQNTLAQGGVAAWGDSSHAQTSIPPGLTNIVSVAAGAFHSLALDTNGRVVGWGDRSHGETTPPAGLSNAVAIAAGNGFSLALLSDGSLMEWGSQTSVPVGLTNVVAIDAASDNAIALSQDGKVTSWGTGYAVPGSVTNVVAVAAGDHHSLALKGDGTVVAWGDPSLGKTAVPDGLTHVVAVAAGEFHSLALRGDGTVVGWGDNTYGQSVAPAGLDKVVAIAAGGRHSLALRQDGTVVAWGDDTYGQSSPPVGLSNGVAIAGGRYHSLAAVGNGSPVITVQPVSQYHPETKQAVFWVRAVGQAPLTYQWRRDGMDIAGATGSSLTLENLATADAGVYSVVVSNALGSVTSKEAVLPPAWQRPRFLAQPQDVSIHCGETAVFQPDVGGLAPLSFQWQFEGADLPGETNHLLVVRQATGDQAGGYSLVVTNANGSTTSRVATLEVIGEPPLITSPLSAAGKQGVPFSYTIAGQHDPTFFSASDLPAGLAANSTNGVISGIPQESGTFPVTLGTANLCAAASTNLTLVITSSIPVISSSMIATGTEQAPFTYQITTTESPVTFGAERLPQGLSVDPVTGLISGNPLYAGDFDAVISASNVWGIGTANLHLSFTNASISGLAITDVFTNYSSPYLLEFQFALRDSGDSNNNHAVVIDPQRIQATAPQLLSLAAFEDDQPVSPSETGVILQRASAEMLRAYLVLDFSDSISSLANGDTNQNGISDAADTLIGSAESFVNGQTPDAQIGVYEFHRDDVAPQKVVPLTTDKSLLNNSIAGIWTNYVQGFASGSRCWDAVTAAINDFGPTNRDERHYVIFISDGKDESSTNTVDDLIAAATNNNVQVYCIGFGHELDAATLQTITGQTQGRYYTATNATDLAAQFLQLSKDLNGQYILRWATLKRSTNSFMPSFQITYQGFPAMSPPNPPPVVTGTNTVVDTNTVPPTTNDIPIYTTNYIISPYVATDYAGDPTVGSLRLVADAEGAPASITLRATYVPRDVRQIRLHYRLNWPGTVSLQSTNAGEMLDSWSLSETNDGAGGQWALLSSPDPQDLLTSIPFATFGKLLTFYFRDPVDASNAFSVFEIDNTIYTNTGGQSFQIENTNDFVKSYPVLTNGTPVPWLIQHGFTANFQDAELGDQDSDGMPTWQEYLAGTDPRNANSKLAVSLPAQTGPFGRYQVTFSTAINRTYRVEVSNDLQNWQPLETNILGTGGSVTVTDHRNPPVLTQTYYRVVVY